MLEANLYFKNKIKLERNLHELTIAKANRRISQMMLDLTLARKENEKLKNIFSDGREKLTPRDGEERGEPPAKPETPTTTKDGNDDRGDKKARKKDEEQDEEPPPLPEPARWHWQRQVPWWERQEAPAVAEERRGGQLLSHFNPNRQSGEHSARGQGNGHIVTSTAVQCEAGGKLPQARGVLRHKLYGTPCGR